MARWTRDGLRVPTCLFEAAAWHYAVKPVCSCGHAAAFDPHGLWWRFEKKGWNDSLGEAKRRFYCRQCWQKLSRKISPVRLDIVRASAGDIVLPLPDECVWKRALSRFRS